MAKKKVNKKKKNNKNLVMYGVIGGALAVGITVGIIVGVNVPKEVTFDEFKTAVEACDAAPYNKVTVKGSYVNSDGNKVSVDNDLTKQTTTVLFVTVTAFTADECDSTAYAYANTTAKLAAISENEDYTYYYGNWGFKLVTVDSENGDKVTYNYDKYGYIKSVKGTDDGKDFSFNLTWGIN